MVEFGAEAEAAALRLHNRRCGGVLGRLGPRSSILGDYSASKAVCLCVCELRNKQALVVCESAVLMRYRAGGTFGASSTLEVGRASALRGESGVRAVVRSPEKPSQTAPSL